MYMCVCGGEEKMKMASVILIEEYGLMRFLHAALNKQHALNGHYYLGSRGPRRGGTSSL